MRIRIATLNVWGLPAPIAPDLTERMRAIAARLSELDLDAIAFQEVWTPEARRELVAGGKRAGLDHVWHREAALGGSGLLILTRLPIEALHFERFALQGVPERPHHIDSLGGKGFVRVRLRTPAGPISLLDTHLHARYGSDVSHEYLGLRTGQVVQIAMGAWEIRDPVVAVGDFNFLEGAPEYRVLTGLTGLADVAAVLDRREPTVDASNPYRQPSQRPSRRIDLVFTRDGVAAGLVPRSIERVFDDVFEIDGRPGTYSDHAGIVAELEIAPRPYALPPPHLDPDAVELASLLLAQGRAEVESLRRGGRTLAGFGIGAAGLAAAGVRTWCMTRRRALRLALNSAAFGALAPSVGFSLLTETTVPDEIAAFERLQTRLLQVARASGQEMIV